MFDTNNEPTANKPTHLGKFELISLVNPCFCILPSREHMLSMAIIIGAAKIISHNWEKPNNAPDIEYVVMPAGSFPAAPVIIPGVNFLIARLIFLKIIKTSYLTKAVTSTPAVTNNPPVTLPKVGFSPKNTNAKIKVRAILNLSTGATLEASPICKAL
jgi:hypothetical protein